MTTAIEYEAGDIVRRAEVEMRSEAEKVEDELQIEHFKERYADSPERLQATIDFYREMREEIEIIRFRTDMLTDETAQALAVHDQQDNAIIAAADYRDAHECTGPIQKKVGIFPLRRTVTVCQLASTPEFIAAQDAREQQTAWLKEQLGQ